MDSAIYYFLPFLFSFWQKKTKSFLFDFIKAVFFFLQEL